MNTKILEIDKQRDNRKIEVLLLFDTGYTKLLTKWNIASKGST